MATGILREKEQKSNVRNTAEGLRSPDVEHSQRKFNTGIVVIVEHGHSPSRELIERANCIRQQWIDFWQRTTGNRASMTVNPR